MPTLRLPIAVVEADNMFGLCKKEPAGGECTGHVAEHGDDGKQV